MRAWSGTQQEDFIASIDHDALEPYAAIGVIENGASSCSTGMASVQLSAARPVQLLPLLGETRTGAIPGHGAVGIDGRNADPLAYRA